MAHYKLNYAPQDINTNKARVNRSQWAITMVWGLGFLVFGLAFFGVVDMAFNHRATQLSLRKEYNQLALKYDSLYAVKLNADKKIAHLQTAVKDLTNKETPK